MASALRPFSRGSKRDGEPCGLSTACCVQGSETTIMPPPGAPYPSGKGAVCKTAMQRFEPARRLQTERPRPGAGIAVPGDGRRCLQHFHFRIPQL
jgi:hypothetical protein